MPSTVPRHRLEGDEGLFREHWRSLQFWRWWWRTSVSSEVKWLLAAALIPTLLVGGYFASGSLSGASASDSGQTGSFVLQTTVRRVVTVRDHGKVVVKRIPVVVRRSVVKLRSRTETSTQTVVNTRTLTTKGGVRTVQEKVVKYVPVTTKVQLVNGKTTTVTDVQTVTNQSTVVQTVTASAPPAQTVTETQTVVQTVTEPAETVTVTVTSSSSGP